MDVIIINVVCSPWAEEALKMWVGQSNRSLGVIHYRILVILCILLPFNRWINTSICLCLHEKTQEVVGPWSH